MNERLWIPGCMVAVFALALLVLFMPAIPAKPVAVTLTPVSLAHRVTEFCGVYGRSIDCTAWAQGALDEQRELAKECHAVYPSPKDSQFWICLEEYGF
jgi:hypothetical protein